jgi:6-pyruvoyl-tetrahydropterin synthase
VEFRRPDLDINGIVVDIGLATDVLRQILAGLNYRNLDDEPGLKGLNTTTEFLAHLIFERIEEAISRGDLGVAAHSIEGIRVTLHESHVASAGYDGRLINRP